MKEQLEEKKIMDAIHMNYINKRNEREMKEQYRSFKEKQEEKYFDKWLKRIFTVTFIGLILEIVGLAIGL